MVGRLDEILGKDEYGRVCGKSHITGSLSVRRTEEVAGEGEGKYNNSTNSTLCPSVHAC